jgi:hypothetical protein
MNAQPSPVPTPGDPILTLGSRVRLHPIIGLRHDGTIRLVEGWFYDQAGKLRVFVSGSVASAALEAISPAR